MITFSLNKISSNTYAYLVAMSIKNNIGYFKFFNKDRWEEAVAKTRIEALTHRDESYGSNLDPYIKKLARTVLRENEKKKKEFLYPVNTEDGEESLVFLSSTSNIDTKNMDGSEELKDIFKELYLKDTESFLKLRLFYNYEIEEDFPSDVKSFNITLKHFKIKNSDGEIIPSTDLKSFNIKNREFIDVFYHLLYKYGSEFTFRVLLDFFIELPSLVATRETGLTKEVLIRKPNYEVLKKIPDTPTIVGSDGENYYIDKNTMTMSRDPDYFKWDIIGSSSCDILKIDISKFMYYMYEQVFADQGVNTKHTMWCGHKYKLVTPSGFEHIGADREKFISWVRMELIVNLIMSGIGAVVAVSLDSVYIKPTRAFKFDRIRIKTKQGEVMDLPITLHLKKRRN